jgi:hypothetical protein
MISWNKQGGRVYPQMGFLSGLFARLAKNLYVPPSVIVEKFEGKSRIESKYLDFSLVTLTKASDSDMVSKQSGGAYMWTEYAAESELQ